MSCRSCEDRTLAVERGAADPSRLWGAERISGLRCSHCGALLGAEDIVRLLLQKQSQLERFGLLKPPSLEPRSPTIPYVRLESD